MTQWPEIKITAKTAKIFEDAGMYVEFTTYSPTGNYKNSSNFHKDFKDEVPCLYVGEEDSDFCVVYAIEADNSLRLITSPSFVADLPKTITRTMQLRKLAQTIAQHAQSFA